MGGKLTELAADRPLLLVVVQSLGEPALLRQQPAHLQRSAVQCSAVQCSAVQCSAQVATSLQRSATSSGLPAASAASSTAILRLTLIALPLEFHTNIISQQQSGAR